MARYYVVELGYIQEKDKDLVNFGFIEFHKFEGINDKCVLDRDKFISQLERMLNTNKS